MNETTTAKILKLAKIEHKVDFIEFGIVIAGFSFLVIKAGGANTILGFSLTLIFLFVTELLLMFYFRKRTNSLMIAMTKEKTPVHGSIHESIEYLYKKRFSNLKRQLTITLCILAPLLIISIVFCILFFKSWIINRWTRPVLIVLYLIVLIPQIYLFGLMSSLRQHLRDEKFEISPP